MQSILSLILILVMLIANLFNSFSPVADDLTEVEGTEKYVLIEEERNLLKDIFESETEWLVSLQLENGAIPMTKTENGTVSVNPYFSDFAALALLDDAEKYADNVKAYMDWHISHLNSKEADYNRIDGTIYDYTITVENGKIAKEEISVKDGKNSYDSTDSYAATFLMVLDKYLEKTGDSEYIIKNADAVSRVAEAMLFTLNMGLTYAKPDYKVMYLMDNCEVYEGCLCAEDLLSLIAKNSDGYDITLQKCKNAAQWISDTIEKKLWNKDAQHYEAGLFADGTVAFDFSWDKYYPCATAQLFPVIHGLINPDTLRANSLYDQFCNTYNWEEFDIPDAFVWGSNVYAAAIMGDIGSVMTYMENYSLLIPGHEYPLYNADAAKVCLTAYMILNNY